MYRPMSAEKDLPVVMAVVLNYNGYDDTVKCIQSLQKATYKNLFIVIVDNGSPDGSGELLKKRYQDLHVILLKENTGYAAGNNAGISYALKKVVDYVLVINNDVIVEPRFLEPMVSIAENDQKVGIVNCKVFYLSENTKIFSAAGKMNWWLCTGINNGNIIKSLQNNDNACFTDYACGVLMLMKREMLEIEGIFDEKFFLYFEDVEYSRRILHRYKIAYTPLGIAYHKSGGGKGWKSYTEMYLYFHTRNRIWAFKKDPFYYQIYVSLFSLINVLFKSVVLIDNIRKDRKKMLRQIKSLWRGFLDGLINKSKV